MHHRVAEVSSIWELATVRSNRSEEVIWQMAPTNFGRDGGRQGMDTTEKQVWPHLFPLPLIHTGCGVTYSAPVCPPLVVIGSGLGQRHPVWQTLDGLILSLCGFQS